MYRSRILLAPFLFCHILFHTVSLPAENEIGNTFPDSITITEIGLDNIEIVATRSRLTSSTRPVYAAINYEDISHLPIKTVADIIKFIPGVDIRERGASGVQADLSVRGGTGNQIKILINGIDLTDPQTEHYSLNIPIDPILIERIEILEGTHYSLTAFSGVINIITTQHITDNKKNYELAGKLTGGEYGLIAPTLALRIENNKKSTTKWHLNSSISYNRSEGYTTNTDYNICNIYIQTRVQNFDLQAGAQMKNAGANAFYSTLYPYQFDFTRMGFITTAYEKKWTKGWNLYTNAYYRTHYDRFELFRAGKQPNGEPAPEWYSPNKHWTHTTGGHIEGGWSNQHVDVKIGIDLKNEIVKSTNLGNHNRTNLLYFAESGFSWKQFAITLGINGIYNSQFGHDWSMGTNLCYRLKKYLRIYLNANRSIRTPTFTDLYYNSPTLQANPNMKPEKAWQLEICAQLNLQQWYGSLSGYYRWGRNIIDWVKPLNDNNTVWISTNHTSVNAMGGEIIIGLQNIAWINKIEVNYSYCNVKTNAGDMLSSYALDFLKHKLILRIDHKIFKGFGASWCGSLKKREGKYETTDGIKYYKPVFLLDGSIYWHNNYLKISIDAKNMTNQTYYDFSGIEQPKHWISGSVEFKL